MSKTQHLFVSCPDCGSDLTVDATTGKVLGHQPAESRRDKSKDFDELLAGLDDSKDRAAAVFQREVAALEDHDRLMDEKFQEALKRAEKDPDKGPPLRPWDLD